MFSTYIAACVAITPNDKPLSNSDYKRFSNLSRTAPTQSQTHTRAWLDNYPRFREIVDRTSHIQLCMAAAFTQKSEHILIQPTWSHNRLGYTMGHTLGVCACIYSYTWHTAHTPHRMEIEKSFTNFCGHCPGACAAWQLICEHTQRFEQTNALGERTRL